MPASLTWWEALKQSGRANRRHVAIRFLLLALAVGILGGETGCASRPRYRTAPPSGREFASPTQKAGETPATEQGPQEKPAGPISTKDAYQVGLASYYAHDFHGRPTASGEIFDMNGLTAAHRELPLGTIIRVTHLGNGRTLEVKVNDRGPFVGNRILDLSLGAARRLDMVQEGVARVKIVIVKAIQ